MATVNNTQASRGILWHFGLYSGYFGKYSVHILNNTAECNLICEYWRCIEESFLGLYSPKWTQVTEHKCSQGQVKWKLKKIHPEEIRLSKDSKFISKRVHGGKINKWKHAANHIGSKWKWIGKTETWLRINRNNPVAWNKLEGRDRAETIVATIKRQVLLKNNTQNKTQNCWSQLYSTDGNIIVCIIILIYYNF